MPSSNITVDPDHNLWKYWDDDGWNGATAGNWIRSYAMNAVITLIPPPSATQDLIARMKTSMEKSGAQAVIVLSDEKG